MTYYYSGMRTVVSRTLMVYWIKSCSAFHASNPIIYPSSNTPTPKPQIPSETTTTSSFPLNAATTSSSSETSFSSSSNKKNNNLIFSFGIIADIQHAPIPDGFSYGGVPRYYRHAKDAAQHAAQHFQDEELPLVCNLGDIIDGKCQELFPEEPTPGLDSLRNVLRAMEAYQCGKVLHTYGNHELYNLDRKSIGEELNIPFVKEETGDLVGYFSELIECPLQSDQDHDDDGTVRVTKLRFIVIDSYDITLLGHPPSSESTSPSPKRIMAEQIMSRHNPNYPSLENSPEGLQDLDRRFVGFNGAVDEPQLRWLRRTLTQARANSEHCIILSHQPIHPGSCGGVTLMWNYEEVLDTLRAFSDIILVSFAGHAHKGGYVRDDRSGIHFRVIEAALETPPPGMTYGVVDVYDNEVVVRGSGRCESARYDLRHMAKKDEMRPESVRVGQQTEQ